MIRKKLRTLKYLLLRLLRIKDKSHSIARGFTIGALINFIPTFGFGPFLSTVFPRIFRGNTVAGFIGGIVFLWSFPILFYFNIVVGERLLPIEIAQTIEEVIETDAETEEVLEVGLIIGKAFIVGMLVNMTFVGITLYFITYITVKEFRRELLQFFHKKWKIKRG